MYKTALLILVSTLLVIPTLAQTPPSASNCSPAGSWYGGSDVKYLLTVVPLTGETFAITAQPIFDVTDLGGYKALTAWSGEFRKISRSAYLGQYISLYTTSSEVPPPPESMELDGVRGVLTFTNCDNIKIAYDRYLIYFDVNKVVFVDVPDLNIDVTGVVEYYRRMPMVCPACSFRATHTSQAIHKR
ncbi:MAG TPA: hypothetical protein VMT53_03650 [Terriglobales bacterium]|nr:hypothetical protein [Terriglobales bacterium]